MHVVILTLVFPPDNVSTARLVGDLATDLSASGCRVTVLTTEPHYNRDTEAEAQQSLRGRWPLLLKESRYHGARVLHTFMPRKGKSNPASALRVAGIPRDQFTRRPGGRPGP